MQFESLLVFILFKFKRRNITGIRVVLACHVSVNWNINQDKLVYVRGVQLI